jgi:hypothetical protein
LGRNVAKSLLGLKNKETDMTTAALSATRSTLLDVAKRLDPDGKIADIAELLSQTNEVLDDMNWQEGNLPTGHRVSIRTGLPTVYFRLMNKGVPSSKSTTVQVDEAAAMLEARSEVDKDLAMLNGNTAAFRLSEGAAFLEAMNQTMASKLIYGNVGTAPEEFTGLATRYSSLSAANGANIVNGSGANSVNTSIYLVVWGPQTAFGIYPRGSQAGLVHEDLGEGDAFDGDQNRFRALMDRWQWKCGLVVKDWRYVVRIANIDKTMLVTETTAADLIKLMVKAYHRIPNLNMGRAAWYMNRTVFQMLDIQRMAAVSTGGGITYENVDGKVVPTFRQIPIRRTDAILNNEGTVS